MPTHGNIPAEIYPAPEGQGLFDQVFAEVGRVLAVIPSAVGSLFVFSFLSRVITISNYQLIALQLLFALGVTGTSKSNSLQLYMFPTQSSKSTMHSQATLGRWVERFALDVVGSYLILSKATLMRRMVKLIMTKNLI